VGIETKECKGNKDGRNEIHEITAGYKLLDHVRNKILRRPYGSPVENKVVQYKQKPLNNVNGVEGIRYSKQLHDCRPIGRIRTQPEPGQFSGIAVGYDLDDRGFESR
jgi:hypothetical protein